MGYYQNVFNSDFFGTLVLSDRQYNVDFKVKANRNSSFLMAAYGLPPYNTAGNTSLTFNVSFNNGAAYATFVVSLTSGSARTVDQIITDLNNDTNFSAYFIAFNQAGFLVIRSLYPRENFRAYIANTSAETVLQFNLHTGIAQLPSYFDRHTIASSLTGSFPNSVGSLVALNQPGDNWLITAAGLSTTPSSDWQLMGGKSGLFQFTKNTIDGSNRITTSIVYPAGALIGDLAKKTTFSYTSTNTNPDKIAEVPYVLTSGDLITPP